LSDRGVAVMSKLEVSTVLLISSYLVAKSAGAVLTLEGRQYEEKKGGDDVVTAVLRGVQRGGYLGCVILGAAMIYAIGVVTVKEIMKDAL